MTIESGEVITYDAQGEETAETHVYGQHLFYMRVFDIEQLISQ